jgi:hypothetical protein
MVQHRMTVLNAKWASFCKKIKQSAVKLVQKMNMVIKNYKFAKPARLMVAKNVR